MTNKNENMRKAFNSISFLLILSVAVVANAAALDCEEYENPQTREAVLLVHDAAALIAKKGDAAFKDFSVKGSRWFDGDNYIFVHALDGTLVCNPAYPQLIGKQMIDFKDVSGKPTVRFMVDQVTKFNTKGWVHYLWPIPGDVELTWKSSFVQLAIAPNGKKYIVGTGLYDVPMERCFAVQQVENAAKLIAKEGAKSFEFLRSRAGPFVWKSTYVYVIGLDGIEYVSPAQSELEGTDISGLTDATGDKFVGRMLKVAESKKGHWITYKWPKPGHQAASTKEAYIKLVRSGGKEYIVGCGVYLD